MPSEKTRADSLREYLTGAISDGGVQANPTASLGNYRSSTEAESMTAVVENPISGITIAFIGGGNSIGAGTLEAVDANTLRWKCFGGSFGDLVAIANGETKIIETAGAAGAYIRVTRTSSASLTGTATITLSQKVNSVFAGDDVSSAEAASGDNEYRATVVKNESPVAVVDFRRWIGVLGVSQISNSTQLPSSGAGTITTTGTFTTWPDKGWCHIKNGSSTREVVYYSSRTNTTLTVPATGRARLGTSAAAGAAGDTIHPVPGVRIAKDDDGVVESPAPIQTIANEGVAPTGVTWNIGITSDTGLVVGNMPAGYQVGIWYHREIPVAAGATANASVIFNDSFDAA